MMVSGARQRRRRLSRKIITQFPPAQFEEGVAPAEMTANEQDWAVVFNPKRIEEAVAKGDFKEIGGVPVLDGKKGSPYTRYIPIPNSPHGINTAPDGIHVTINGKLSPTVSVMDVRKLDDLFDDKIQPREVIVAEPELGLGPHRR